MSLAGLRPIALAFLLALGVGVCGAALWALAHANGATLAAFVSGTTSLVGVAFTTACVGCWALGGTVQSLSVRR